MKEKVYLAIMVAVIGGCNPKQDQVKTPETKIIAVAVTEAKSELVAINLKYSGTVEPSQAIPLTFQTTGKVEKVLVDIGDNVKKGQLLATIDKTDLQNIYDIARTKYDQAKDAYDRLKSVHDQGSMPDIKWVEMETNLEQAKLSLELSKNNLDKCNLRAPVNGIVGSRNIEPGMSSVAILPAPIELVDINTVFVKISVPENEIGRIKKRDKASFIVAALNNRPFQGEVIKVSPIADPLSRTYEAKIIVNNPDHDLKPGMVCDVTLNLKSDKELVLIPYQSASMDKDGHVFVFVVNTKQKIVKKQIIQPGNYQGGEFLEVVSGLTPGQIIVSGGKEKLSDNSLISL